MPTPFQTSDSSTNEAGPDAGHEPSNSTANAEQLWENIRSLANYLMIYLETYLDRGKLTFKNFVLGLVLTIFILALAIGISLIGAGFLFYGLSLGIAELSGERGWVGFSTVGALLLLASWLSIRYATHKLKSSSLNNRIKDYAARTKKQRAEHKAQIFDLEEGVSAKRA